MYFYQHVHIFPVTYGVLIYKFNLINSLRESSISSSNWTFRKILFQDISPNLFFPLSFIVRLLCNVFSSVWIISVLWLVYPPFLSNKGHSFLLTAYMQLFISISQGNFLQSSCIVLLTAHCFKVSLGQLLGEETCVVCLLYFYAR